MNGSSVRPGGSRCLKQTNRYYLTLGVLLAAIAVYASLALFNYGYLGLRFPGLGVAAAYASYNTVMFPPGFLRTNGLYALVKCAAIVGVSIWGLVALRRESRSAGTALYVLAALVLLDWLLPTLAVFRAALRVSAMTGFGLGRALAQTFGITFYVFTSLVMFAVVLACAIAVARYFRNGATAPALPKKEISGIGGWMILCAIRCVFMPLSLLYGAVVAVGGLLRVPLFAREVTTQVNMEFALVYVLAAVLAVIVVVKLFQKDFAFKPLVIFIEALNIVVSGVSVIYMVTRVSPQILERTGYYGGGMITTLFAMVVSALFILYYAKSDRVKNTYQKALWSQASTG